MRIIKQTMPAIFALFLCTSFVYADYHTDFLKKVLKMDDLSSPSAIAPLEKVLSDGGNSILPCAAAQALFLMDTPEANAILKKWLRFPHYDLDYSIKLTSHWGLHPIKRNQFIREYHLSNSSEDVKILVKSAPSADKNNTMEFTISLTNTSGNSLRFYKPLYYLGESILLASEEGDFADYELLTKYTLGKRPPEESFPEVAPGKSLSFSFVAKAETYPDSAPQPFRYFAWLNCGDSAHRLTKTGKFKVYARYHWEETKNPPFTNIWTGRLVSEPIEIEIPKFSEPIKFPVPPSNQKPQTKQ